MSRLLAIIGDSGCGKATLASGIARLLGAERVSDVCLDDYHRYDRAERHRRRITALHPDCNDLELAATHLATLRRGEAVVKPVYDHRDGTFGPAERLVPKEFVIVHGLLGCHTEALTRSYHLSVFLDPQPDIRVQWKLQRDTMRRGYAPEQVLEQLAHRRHDAERFVGPQRERADVVVRFFAAAAAADAAHLSVRITLRGASEPHEIQHLLAELARRADGRWLRVDATGVEIDGGIPDDAAAHVARALRARLPRAQRVRLEQLGTFDEGRAVRHSHPLALTQLLLAATLLRAANASPAAAAASAS